MKTDQLFRWKHYGVRLEDQAVTGLTVWGKRETIPWSEIGDVRIISFYTPVGMAVKVVPRSRDKRPIVILPSWTSRDVGQLVNMLKERAGFLLAPTAVDRRASMAFRYRRGPLVTAIVSVLLVYVGLPWLSVRLMTSADTVSTIVKLWQTSPDIMWMAAGVVLLLGISPAYALWRLIRLQGQQIVLDPGGLLCLRGTKVRWRLTWTQVHVCDMRVDRTELFDTNKRRRVLFRHLEKFDVLNQVIRYRLGLT